MNGEENDWTSKNWRRILVGMSRAGVGKSIKNGMNRKERRQGKAECRVG